MAVFNSKDARFDTERCRSLGPAAYINDTEPIYQMKGISSGVFGTQAERVDLL